MCEAVMREWTWQAIGHQARLMLECMLLLISSCQAAQDYYM